MPGKRKYNSEKERKEARKKVQKKYFNSEKGKLAIAKMSKSGARKKAQKKYFNSKKGKEAIKRANKSEAKKKAQKKYISTEKGKTKFQKGVKRYKKTDKGKKAQKESVQRYDNSEKGKQTRGNYYQSDNYIKAHKRYRLSNKFKATIKKYFQSSAGKEIRRRQTKRKLSTPEGRIEMNLRIYIYKSLKKDQLKKSKRLEELLGCNIKQLKNYIESLFTEGMSWENYGEWHIDHIVPIDFFRKNYDFKDIEIQKECFHYLNLQPLWAIDNIKKGNKLK